MYAGTIVAQLEFQKNISFCPITSIFLRKMQFSSTYTFENVNVNNSSSYQHELWMETVEERSLVKAQQSIAY